MTEKKMTHATIRLPGNGENVSAVVNAAGQFVYVSEWFALICADCIETAAPATTDGQCTGKALQAQFMGMQAGTVLSRFWGLPDLPREQPWRGTVRVNGCSEKVLMEVVPLPANQMTDAAASEEFSYLLVISPCPVSVRMQCAGRLARGLAHDFNNSLASIMGFAELAAGQTGAGGNKELLSRSVTNILKGCERAGHVLERARTIAGRIPLEAKKYQPERLLGRWCDELAKTLPANIKLECPADIAASKDWELFRDAADSHVPDVFVDIGWLDMAFEEVWKNALSAMPSGGTLRVGCATCHAGNISDCTAEKVHEVSTVASSVGSSAKDKRPCWVVLWIEDTGRGMSNELQQRAVEPFYTGQIDSLGKDDAGGQGWGLSLAWGVLAAHGGRLEVDSRQGNGSLVSFWLPAGE